jgi:hypothetical protein
MNRIIGKVVHDHSCHEEEKAIPTLFIDDLKVRRVNSASIEQVSSLRFESAPPVHLIKPKVVQEVRSKKHFGK